jgi:hypothetical protein
MSYVIGVDVGGTFTDAVLADAVLADETGTVIAAKSPSTPPQYSTGVLEVLHLLAAQLGIGLSAMLAETQHVAHGTTSSLNALVTGNVPPTGFITTRGHRDSIYIMNVEGRYLGDSPDQAQDILSQTKSPGIVPKRHAVEVTERLDRDGRVVVALDEDDARRAIGSLIDQGIRAIALSLLWSFRNPGHEERVRELIHEVDADVFVALSSEVSPRIREFARNATTIMSTQVAPRLRTYLATLETVLREHGLRGPLLVMRSDGGAITSGEAPRHAISTVGSVLTGGVIGSVTLGGQLGHRNIVSTDVGGTTFLVGLVVDGEPVRATTTVINHHPINVPSLNVHAIGSGGSAVVWIDAGGNLRVGPRSAQAVPGPTCYGRGGTEPTNTDANLVLGILTPRGLLGGTRTLDLDAARRALRSQVADPLGLTVEDERADHLSFDFTGTDRQADVINCTYAGLRGGIMLALLSTLAGNIPWSAGRLIRCFDLITDEGTINNATFPAAVCRGPIGPAWLTGSLVVECLSQMLDQSLELGRNVQASCCGTWDGAVVAGLDEGGHAPVPVVNDFMEPMAGGFGARRHADGMDTGGHLQIPMGRVPYAEMTEFLYPVLLLWRREQTDSGGPGQQRGGLSASLAVTPWGTSTPMGQVLGSAGKAIAQNNGFTGGYPGNAGLEQIARGTDVVGLVRSGVIPQSLGDVGGGVETAQNYVQTTLAPGDVFAMMRQSGGGFGEPLLRDVGLVAHDVEESKVSAQAARDVYGVVLSDTGEVDQPATEQCRRQARELRLRRASAEAPGNRPAHRPCPGLSPQHEPGPTGNRVHHDRVRTLRLRARRPDIAGAGPHRGPPTIAGPHILTDAADYVDHQVVFRQLCCPACAVSLDRHSSALPSCTEPRAGDHG